MFLRNSIFSKNLYKRTLTTFKDKLKIVNKDRYINQIEDKILDKELVVDLINRLKNPNINEDKKFLLNQFINRIVPGGKVHDFYYRKMNDNRIL